jgi:hypothetical protein
MSTFDPIPWQPCLVSHRRCFFTSLSTLPCFYPPWLYPHILSLFTPSLPGCFPLTARLPYLLMAPEPPAVCLTCAFTFTFTHPIQPALSFVSSRSIPHPTHPRLVCTHPCLGTNNTQAHTDMPIHPHRFTARL